MRPRSKLLIVAAVLGVVVCKGVAHHAAAKVVEDRRADPANPAVAVGGVRLPPGPRPPIQYSLIGALAAEGRWFAQCAYWPWRLFGAPTFRHGWYGGRWRQPPAIEWVPPAMR